MTIEMYAILGMIGVPIILLVVTLFVGKKKMVRDGYVWLLEGTGYTFLEALDRENELKKQGYVCLMGSCGDYEALWKRHSDRR